MALTNTITHAKFVRMRMQLGIPSAWLLGHLEMYWQYCHAHGHVMKSNLVEFAAGWAEAFPDRTNEFMNAAIDCGWIDWENGDTVSAHDYMANAPRFVKNREQTRERMANIRKQKQTPQTKANITTQEPEMFDNVCNGLHPFDNVTHGLTIDIDVDVDIDKEPKEELMYVSAPSKPARKRSAKPDATIAPKYSEAFETAWKAYPHRGSRSSKAESYERWRSMRLEAVDGLPSKIVGWIEYLKAQPDWTKNSGEFVPGFQVWLSKRVWTNGDPPAAAHKELACEWEVE
jgi:hypothetical protein